MEKTFTVITTINGQISGFDIVATSKKEAKEIARQNLCSGEKIVSVKQEN